MRLSTSWMYQQSLGTMINQQSTLAATQNQVSTGKRINVASDDPAGAGRVVSLNHVLAANTQYTANIDAAATRLDTAQSTLNSVNDLYNSARDLTLQALNGSLADSDRQAIATQLTQLRDQLVQQANTTDATGQALFAGTSSTAVPFVKNPDGSVSYGGNSGQPRAAIGAGLTVSTGNSGSSIFIDLAAGNGRFAASASPANAGGVVVGENTVSDPVAYAAGVAANGSYTVSFDGAGNWSALDAGGNPVLDGGGNPVVGSYADGGSLSFNGITLNLEGVPQAGDSISVQPDASQDVFTTFNNLIGALQAGGSSAQLTNTLNRQLESLDQAQAAVTRAEVDIGGRTNALAAQRSAYEDLSVTYKSTLSDTRDVDVYTAISNLSIQSTALQASQQVFAQVKSLSLFNYIK
ncbi:flagellar hook-associated protein FlgL [Dyella sp.]|jgi:flagellar hook-associated protein 3 FlgL|uniref:flagellar hook-associated protein FlgL n=1 Tax=Dyella sp. TaxID=1869338 RepID=UPI002D7949D4|nr:flagellar hook-associated protein FlgL [Dyella sp.]HET6433844.1 flagellar hook-associated protein FlgL [Dyella sp.]